MSWRNKKNSVRYWFRRQHRRFSHTPPVIRSLRWLIPCTVVLIATASTTTGAVRDAALYAFLGITVAALGLASYRDPSVLEGKLGSLVQAVLWTASAATSTAIMFGGASLAEAGTFRWTVIALAGLLAVIPVICAAGVREWRDERRYGFQLDLLTPDAPAIALYKRFRHSIRT